MPVYDRTGTECAPGPQPGARALYDFVIDRWDARPLGIYNCRNVRNGSRLSEHAEGRAVDLGFDAFDPVDLARADEICEWLVANADLFGIQSVIWNHQVWGYGRWEWRPYTGVAGPHTDHIHAGLNWYGAQILTTETLEASMSTAGELADQALAPEDFRQPDGTPHNVAYAALETNGHVSGKQPWNLFPRLERIEQKLDALTVLLGDLDAIEVDVPLDDLVDKVLDAAVERLKD